MIYTSWHDLAGPNINILKSTDYGQTWFCPETGIVGATACPVTATLNGNDPNSGYIDTSQGNVQSRALIDPTNPNRIYLPYADNNAVASATAPPTNNDFDLTRVRVAVSNDGGATYTGPFSISKITAHTEAGNLRSGPLPSAEIDSAGTVYVVWEDCRFITNCTANDIVMSTSSDGKTWSAVARIPIDTTTSGVDHFIPGLAVDVGTSGGSAHLGLTYYFYPNTSCTTSTCQLDVGFISSTNGGSTWGTATQLAGPFTLTWLPLTSQGYMVGDYISTSFSGGTAHGVFAGATAGSCTLGQVTSCNEFMETPSSGLAAVSSSHSSKGDKVVFTSQSSGSIHVTH